MTWKLYSQDIKQKVNSHLLFIIGTGHVHEASSWPTSAEKGRNARCTRLHSQLYWVTCSQFKAYSSYYYMAIVMIIINCLKLWTCYKKIEVAIHAAYIKAINNFQTYTVISRFEAWHYIKRDVAYQNVPKLYNLIYRSVKRTFWSKNSIPHPSLVEKDC
jgi:hypothetical protein